MITGHCSSGACDKCPAPGRCSHDCHGAAQEPERGRDMTVPHVDTLDSGEHRCPQCPVAFRREADRDHHVATIHRPETEMPTRALDETCPHPGCGVAFANTHARGAHYRINPTHKPADYQPGTRPARPPTGPKARAARSATPADEHGRVEVLDRTWTLGSGGTIRLALELDVPQPDATFIEGLLQLVRELDEQLGQ